MKTTIKNGKTFAQRSDLKPWDDNPRDIKPDELKQLVADIQEFGQFKPIIVNASGLVLGGNQRLKAFEELGIDEIWVSIIEEDNPRRAFRLAIKDNERYGYYLEDKLADLVSKYELEDIDLAELKIDTSEVKSLGEILQEQKEENETEEDEAPEPPAEAISEPGKVYQLGKHRVICGDATSVDDIAKLMGSVSADLYLTDPPYNVAYNNDSASNLKARRRRQDTLTLLNDKFESSDEFKQFLVNSFAAADSHLKGGASFYIWHADMESVNFRQAVEQVGWSLRQNLIWNKNVFVMGRQDYHWKHEPCLYGWKSASSHHWYSDRKQSTVLQFDRPSKSGEHPTMKPIALLAYQIANNSKEGDIVLDSFLGSGSTLIAAHQLDRVCYGLELDPRYVDVIRMRYANLIEAEDWQAATPEVA